MVVTGFFAQCRKSGLPVNDIMKDGKWTAQRTQLAMLIHSHTQCTEHAKWTYTAWKWCYTQCKIFSFFFCCSNCPCCLAHFNSMGLRNLDNRDINNEIQPEL